MPGYTDPTIHKQPVTSCGSILLGELIAIKMVINEIQNQAVGVGGGGGGRITLNGPSSARQGITI